MLWLYLLAAILIAWGIVNDISRQETWMIGFGKVVRQAQPGKYWLTVMLRLLLFFAVVIAAYLRSRMS